MNADQTGIEYLGERLEAAYTENKTLRDDLARQQSELHEMRRLLHDVDQCSPWSLDNVEDEDFRFALQAVRDFLQERSA